MVMWVQFLLLLIFNFIVRSFCKDGPIVAFRMGQVRGTVLKSYDGRDYHAFIGIPYGKSTSGLSRFKPPVPVDPWEGILNATKPGPDCPQMNAVTKTPKGNENCLFLNVYIPQVEDNTKPLPVLAFIHGGGFLIGSGSPSELGPEKFMDHDAILVTFNYRLGIFGFINTEDSVAPGNYGMLDQVLALRWVRENIADFGGDSGKVTIFGESAGGASVAYHLLSPLSEGLFDIAISQSGSPLSSFALQEKPLFWAQSLALEVRCPVDNTRVMFDCLQYREANHLVNGHQKLHEVEMMPFLAAPSVEGPGGEGFLTERPLILMKERRISNKVPFIAGMTSDEGYFFYTMFNRHYKNVGKKMLGEDFAKYLYLSAKIEPEMTLAIDLIYQKYFSDEKIVNSTELITSQMIKLVGEGMVTAGISKMADFFADAEVPTLAYLYNHTGQHSLTSLLGQPSGTYVSHGDELFIQFKVFFPKMNEKDKKMSDLMNSLWVTIANGEVPVIPVDGQDVEWDLYDTKERRYLFLSLKPELRSGVLCENSDFWVTTVRDHMKRTSGTHKDEL